MPDTGNNAAFGSCPLPLDRYPHIVMAHGGGGALTRRLITDMFRSVFSNPQLDRDHDSAVFPAGSGKIAMTTDSYVVHPLFFPGGNIGELAVYGTVNDLCMAGAVPRYLSLGLVLEEGLETEILWQIVNHIGDAAKRCDVQIVTGDTKVVERGKGDGIYINTAGIGWVADGTDIAPTNITAGDAIIISGDIGRHGIAVLASREGLAFQTDLKSDCAPLIGPVRALLDAGIPVHCLRDLTRGGLGAALIELAGTSGLGFAISDPAVPVSAPVRSACDLLGFDPYFVANEGRFVALIPDEKCNEALSILRSQAVSAGAVRIGTVTAGKPGLVEIANDFGGVRILQLFSGEQLPRIC